MAEGGSDTGGAGRRPVAFISYHSSQEKTARHLKEILERNGVQGWMAPDDIDPGVAFDQAIIEQVEKSDLIVLLFCSQSDQSRHVKRELMMAEDRKKLIYPVRLEDIDAKGLAYWLNDYQWIDWIDRRDATITRLIETIKRQVDTGEETAAPPADAPPDETEPAATVSPPAAEPSAGTRPLGLMSAGGDDNGGGADAPPTFLGITLNRAGWYVIGGAAVVAAILLGLVVNSLTGSGEYELRAGEWETRYEIDRILTDGGLPRSEVDAFRTDFEGAVETQCITSEQVRMPLVDFFDPEGASNCSMSNLTMEGGRFRVRVDCRPDYIEGRSLQVFMRGTYTETQIDAEAEYVYFPDEPDEFRFVANQTGTHMGACE